MTHQDIKELGERELDHAAGGETAPVGNAAPTQAATQGTSASPDFGFGRGWCYWHPYVCRK
ncbi:hypothetical protein JQ604_21195 [Bradyrhizobium jicamae]|uniref:hypothetical protein n=1 Tax=Bradyrhizobium jicamae TaxID=280332 RepID=UPI001BA8BC7D|nr:hypothetical protein [Bradyrhizobium jicamae]MBR0754711.1 hypothetical protein [Bradyrhizobium jicamae]